MGHRQTGPRELDEPCVYEAIWGAIAWNKAAVTWMEKAGCMARMRGDIQRASTMVGMSQHRRGHSLHEGAEGAMGSNVGGHLVALSSQHGWRGQEWMKTEAT